MADMHCPICKAVRDVSWGVQIKCDKCGNWSHVDNWTYTKTEWKRLEERREKRYGKQA